tara:strand:+ start:219 stop:425 length:207 start_codon:yes stop_codon:yes gene_type:complete
VLKQIIFFSEEPVENASNKRKRSDLREGDELYRHLKRLKTEKRQMDCKDEDTEKISDHEEDDSLPLSE